MQIFHEYISKFDIVTLFYDNGIEKQTFFNALNWTRTAAQEQGSPLLLPVRDIITWIDTQVNGYAGVNITNHVHLFCCL